MGLIEFYQSLERDTPPKTALVRELADRCGVSVETVRWWLNGKTRPGKKELYPIISETIRDFNSRRGVDFSIPENELFPDESNA